MRRHFGSADREYMDDETLHQVIKEVIYTDAVFNSGPGRKGTIVIEVHDGVVTLTGVVRNLLEKRRADIIARGLGALGVDNQLEVYGQKASERSGTT
jgi:osmotically-inducible protein OsmY